MTFKESYLLLFLFSLLYWKHIDLWPSKRGTQGTANFVYCYETGLVSLVTNIAQQCVHIYENKRLSEGKECHGRQRSGVFSPQSVVFIHHTTSKSAITLTPRTNSSEKNRGSNNFWTQLIKQGPICLDHARNILTLQQSSQSFHTSHMFHVCKQVLGNDKIFFFSILVCVYHFTFIWMIFLLITILSFLHITHAFLLIIYINVKLLRKITISCDTIKALHRYAP